MKPPIWAPWRMDYVTGRRRAECVFCELGASKPGAMREGLVLVAQQHALVCLNKYPFTTSHLLIAPRTHTADFPGLEGETFAQMMELVRQSSARLREAVNAEALNVGFNIGKAAGAGIDDHLHAHIVPRWSGDTNFMPVLADVRVMPEYLDEAWKRLYPFFADLPGVRAPSP